jgi:hypothetical protein
VGAATVAGAANVRTPEPAAVDVYNYDGGDRAASAITIRDVRGRLWQVNNGVLTRAASSAGLEVTER